VKQSGAMGGVSGRINIIMADSIAIAIRKTTPTPRAPMSQFSNIEELVSYLDSFAHSINFKRKGADRELGEAIVETIIYGEGPGSGTGIRGRCEKEVTPEGSPWPANPTEYASDKEAKYGWSEVNHRTGQMLSEPSLKGRTRIEPELITMVYGTDSAPSKSYSPTGYLSKSDEKTTDVKKATIAHAAGRGFYGLGQGDPENVAKVGQEYVNEAILEHNAGA
jgi:hypothetical protein